MRSSLALAAPLGTHDKGGYKVIFTVMAFKYFCSFSCRVLCPTLYLLCQSAGHFSGLPLHKLVV